MWFLRVTVLPTPHHIPDDYSQLQIFLYNKFYLCFEPRFETPVHLQYVNTISSARQYL